MSPLAFAQITWWMWLHLWQPAPSNNYQKGNNE